MKKIIIIICISFIVLILGGVFWFSVQAGFFTQLSEAERIEKKAREEAIEYVIDTRRAKRALAENEDPFGKDGIVRVLLIGLDKRAGQTMGHCDAIQMITVDQKKDEVLITAVPRGTYSPLPPGKATTSSDYYVSNACGLAGLEYGIEQIEKILGTQADYLVVVGFSETMGILRSLRLPTTETLQWLRQRQVYAIGEPQRARNHSTFIRKTLIDYIPDEPSKIDRALHYIVYKIVKTDLSFDEAEAIADALSGMDLSNHPERIQLAMKPPHDVQDIPYLPQDLEKYLSATMSPIKNRLSSQDYSGISEKEMQKQLLAMIEEKKNDPEFISWAFENDLWLQIEEDETRLTMQYEFLQKYLKGLEDKVVRERLVADYVLEMEHLGEHTWAAKGKRLIAKEFGT